MARWLGGILRDKDFELCMFSELLKSFKDCKKMLSGETANRVEKNRFERYVTSVKLRQNTMSGVLYKQRVVVLM